MPTMQEIIEEAERRFPQDRERQRAFISERLPTVGEDYKVTVNGMEPFEETPIPTVEETASKLQPTLENARFIQKLEQVDDLEELYKPATAPVVNTSPSPNKPKDEDVKFLVDLVEEFGTEAPSRIDGYTDEQLESLIDLNAPQSEEARAELEARRSGDISKKLQRLSGQFLAGAAEVPTSGPIALAGLLAKAGEFISGADLGADELLEISGAIRENVRKDIGISEPRDITESLATIAGGMMPIPGAAAPTGVLGNALELTTPLVVGSGNKRVAANFIIGAAAEQGVRELADTAEDDYKTVFDIAGFTGGDDRNYPAALGAIGTGLGLLTGASLLGPKVIQQIRNNATERLQKAEPVRLFDPTGPENLKTLERSKDVAKAHIVDDKEVLVDLAERAGVGNLAEIRDRIDQDTGMSAVMRVNEALFSGNLRTREGTWSVGITPNQLLNEYGRLPKAMQTDIDHYLKYKDAEDVLSSKIDIVTKKLNDEDISPDDHLLLSQELDDMQSALVDVRKNASVLASKTPEALEFSSRYKHIIGATQDFLSQGETGMISPETLQSIQKNRPNFVPQSLIGIDPEGNLLERLADATRPVVRNDDIELDVTKRVNSFEALGDYTRAALQSKMTNDTRSAYTRAIRDSEFGNETLVPATPKDVRKYRSRIVEVWENGKRKKYLSSQLQADLLRFDPHYAKYPKMYMAKRLWEHGTTGALSQTFALTTAIRDGLAGWVLKEPGIKAANPLEIAVAVPEQVWNKTKLAFVNLLEETNKDIPFLDTHARRQLSDQLSNSYLNSYTHMFNEFGGVDASLTKTNVQVAQGTLREISKTADEIMTKVPGLKLLGHNLAALANGFATLFNAVAEAPRYATAKKNIRAGVEPGQAVAASRRITGDVTRSGRVFTGSGRLITGDVTDKSRLAATTAVGQVADFLRQTTPYVNPTIQGFRKLANAYIADPVGTNMRAWLGIGVPALAATAWNEMLGEEYNKYAFERRRSSDIAMNIYIGIPGLPPEQGIQVPISHELMPYNSPWTTALYGLIKGEDGEDIQNSMMHMAFTMLENGAMVGFPTVGSQMFAAAGMQPPDSILTPWNWADDVYQVREDNAGLLPSNVELLLRNTFGSIQTANLAALSSFYEGGPEAFFDELRNNLIKSTPIVRDVLGARSGETNFTPLSQEKFEKVNILREFTNAYDEHVLKPDMLTARRITTSQGILDDDSDVFTRQRLAPIGTPTPTNPVFLEYGDMVKDVLDRNSEGWYGMEKHYSLLTKQINSLKLYTAGRKDEFKRWQKDIVGSDAKYQKAMEKLDAVRNSLTKNEVKQVEKALAELKEKARADRLLTELKIDLSNRDDVKRLIDHLQAERIEITKQQLKLVAEVEDRITADMISRGMLQQGQRFKIEDLRPY